MSPHRDQILAFIYGTAVYFRRKAVALDYSAVNG